VEVKGGFPNKVTVMAPPYVMRSIDRQEGAGDEKNSDPDSSGKIEGSMRANSQIEKSQSKDRSRSRESKNWPPT